MGSARMPGIPVTRSNRGSLEDLQKWAQAWRRRSASLNDCAQIPLPPSDDSDSTAPTYSEDCHKLEFGQSLEQLAVRPEDVPLPASKTESRRRKQTRQH